MREITLNEMNNVSGAGDVNWVDVGKTVATNGAGVIGGAFGAGLCGPVCAGAFAVGSSAAVAALYDAAGNSNSAKQNQKDYLQKHGTTLKVECVIGVQIILVMFVYK